MCRAIPVMVVVFLGWASRPTGWAAESDAKKPAPEAASAAGSGAIVGDVAATGPAFVEPEIREGQLQLRVGNAAEAEVAFRRALEMDPQNRTALFGLGTACIGIGNYGEATAVLEMAARLYPEDYVIKNNMAWMFATARDPRFRDGKRAIELAQEALLLAPGDYHVWSTLSEAYYVAGRYKNALRAAEEALEVGRLQRLPVTALQEYLRQVERCRLAANALSILE